MDLNFIEDKNARRWREQEMSKQARVAARACLTFGVPASLLTGLALHVISPDDTVPVIVAVLVPAVLYPAFRLLPLVARLYRNRWTVTESRLRITGETCGWMRRSRVVAWSVRAKPEHPGYYLLRVATRYSAASILLSETTYPLKDTEALLRLKTKTEPGAPNGGPAGPSGNSGVGCGPLSVG